MNNPIWIDPKKITRCAGEFNTLDHRIILDGDWDTSVRPAFEDNVVFYNDYKRRIEENLPWEKTEIYSMMKEAVENGIYMKRCKNIKDIKRRLYYWDKTYKDIRDNGYKDIDDKKVGNDRIGINVGRDGKIYFNNGRHRLTFAKLLKLKSIPVTINNVHVLWDKFKSEILEYAKSHSGKIYSPIDHPDLQDIPSYWGHHRYNIIKKNLGVKKGSLLDIGSHWGYFSGRFEELGFHVVSCENNSNYLYFLKKIKESMERNFIVLDMNILKSNIKFEIDVVLALNIFHHFLKTELKYNDWISLLKRIKAKEMYFQAHNPLEKPMKSAYKNYTPNEFVECIIENSCFNKFKRISKLRNRHLFKLWVD